MSQSGAKYVVELPTAEVLLLSEGDVQLCEQIRRSKECRHFGSWKLDKALASTRPMAAAGGADKVLAEPDELKNAVDPIIIDLRLPTEIEEQANGIPGSVNLAWADWDEKKVLETIPDKSTAVILY
ncbi:hypothetical protein CYMTET_3536 [Cymbomonas tetramitiformis]|uniref:Rhodanese domain-containing protein n=1 Tax=Cymbomonas tetramitiformis TaxID=36881 RepID=A0AAE0LLF0_9CHLO|nr:hypothetical protein CYMTET_3536 [Cymbomonas tetramitiformis]